MCCIVSLGRLLRNSKGGFYLWRGTEGRGVVYIVGLA